MTTKADQWLDVIRLTTTELDDALEIDDYKKIWSCLKVIRGHLDRIEDGMMEFLTAYTETSPEPEPIYGTCEDCGAVLTREAYELHDASHSVST